MIKHKSVNHIRFSSVPSTNTWVKENTGLLDPNKVSCIMAEEQTAGRGTFSKRWISPKGLNIYATLYFTLPKSYPFLQNLGQLLCISCCKYLEKADFSPEIKWPNDLFLQGKKLGGVLCEIVSLPEETGVVLGFGLNVNMPPEMNRQIDQPATSLLEIGGRLRDMEPILEGITMQFLEDLDTLSGKGFAAFFTFYNERLAFKEKSISVKDGTTFRNGICKGVSPEGSLLLTDLTGEQISICSGKIGSCSR